MYIHTYIHLRQARDCDEGISRPGDSVGFRWARRGIRDVLVVYGGECIVLEVVLYCAMTVIVNVCE